MDCHHGEYCLGKGKKEWAEGGEGGRGGGGGGGKLVESDSGHILNIWQRR